MTVAVLTSWDAKLWSRRPDPERKENKAHLVVVVVIEETWEAVGTTLVAEVVEMIIGAVEMVVRVEMVENVEIEMIIVTEAEKEKEEMMAAMVGVAEGANLRPFL